MTDYVRLTVGLPL